MTIDECVYEIKQYLANNLSAYEGMYVTKDEWQQIVEWLEELKLYREKCNIPLREIASKVMERQKKYHEDTYHYFMKGVQAMVIAIEKEIETQLKEGADK